MAPLQKRAFYGVIFGIVWIIAMVLVFILMGGASVFDENQAFRIIMDVIWIGGLVFYLALFYPIIRRPNQVDERDKLILDRSPRAQWLAIIFTLVAWVIGLSEAFRGQGVPTVFLSLMFFTILCVSAVAQCAGILLGYRSMDKNG